MHKEIKVMFLTDDNKEKIENALGWKFTEEVVLITQKDLDTLNYSEEKLTGLKQQIKDLEQKEGELNNAYSQHAKALESLENIFAYLNKPKRIVGQVVSDN